MLLELDHISKIYGDLHAVDDLNLTVPEGEWLAIVGSSGSGKTTLMNMIGCMDTPSKGSVKLEGRKLEDLNATQLADVRKNLIGLVFQKFYLVPHLTAVENVMVAQYYHSVVDEKQAMEALRGQFKPEFLNRIDDIVVFSPLGFSDIEKIVDIQLKDVRERLDRDRIKLELTPEAVQSLAMDGLDPVYGARPLKRLIQRQVVDNIANLIIAGDVHEGDTVKVDVGADDKLFAARDAQASEAVEPDSVE